MLRRTGFSLAPMSIGLLAAGGLAARAAAKSVANGPRDEPLARVRRAFLTATAGTAPAPVSSSSASTGVIVKGGSGQVWKPAEHYDELSDLDGCTTERAAAFEGMPMYAHWRTAARNSIGEVDVRMPHAVYSPAELEAVEVHHTVPLRFVDKAAYGTVWTLRRAYDLMTGYTFGLRSENAMVRRVVILETVAGVPGIVGAAIRHLRSLRTLSRDYGFIHTLLEEAENERMHLMMALMMNQPGKFVRALVMTAQTLFVAWYSAMYALSPRYCHRFVGYLEEEAVKTYSGIVNYIDEGRLPGFTIPACPAIRAYYRLPEAATLRDVFLCIRADEAHHREVNHTFADIANDKTALNPFPPGY